MKFKVEIIWRDGKQNKTTEFDGDKAMEEGFKFIAYNSPMTVLTICTTYIPKNVENKS